MEIELMMATAYALTGLSGLALLGYVFYRALTATPKPVPVRVRQRYTQEEIARYLGR
ncbi:MAG: hypothetical protein QNJ69_13975 [Gammaproteobacteria bacterium]|nr:hypothetical protein [Gammaproteobacteria bacterium]